MVVWLKKHLVCFSFLLKVDKKRLIHSKDGTLWLRIEDAAFMDTEGRIWLAGRVKWRSINETSGATYWSSIVEQKVGHIVL